MGLISAILFSFFCSSPTSPFFLHLEALLKTFWTVNCNTKSFLTNWNSSNFIAPVFAWSHIGNPGDCHSPQILYVLLPFLVTFLLASICLFTMTSVSFCCCCQLPIFMSAIQAAQEIGSNWSVIIQYRVTFVGVYQTSSSSSKNDCLWHESQFLIL